MADESNKINGHEELVNLLELDLSLAICMTPCSNPGLANKDLWTVERSGKLCNDGVLRHGWADDISHLFVTHCILWQTLAHYSLCYPGNKMESSSPHMRYADK